MSVLNIGIMPREKFQQRVLDIAAGRYKPKKNEPKIWFNSMKSLSEVLSDNNVRLLKMIEEKQPESLKELEALSGRRSSNLSRTLHNMESYGIVEMKKVNRQVRPVVKATEFSILYAAC